MAISGRRALFALLVVATIGLLLWLAILAVPPTSFGGIAFLALFTITLPWSVVGFWNAFIGFLIMRACRDPAAAVNPLANSITGSEPLTASTAIVMCIRNENAQQVACKLEPLLEGLVQARVASHFHLYLLSDSADPDFIAEETACFSSLIARWQSSFGITYRRRPINTGFKAGNIRDFCYRWGKHHDFAITLDADSFMPAETLLRLVRIGQLHPRVGILQTLVVGLPSFSAFARLFQFGMRLAMRSYTLGATWWQADCGPYWGHNALIRLAPFIAHCRLPVLRGDGPLSGYLLSHDQVEAALMRRAGYEVWVLPVDGISWEETPPTLIEFTCRDLRWCQGNMQYWRLLRLPGLKLVSRFHLAFAIWMYLCSAAWMVMMGLGTLLFVLSDTALTQRRVSLHAAPGRLLLIATVIITLAPKLTTAIDIMLTSSARRSFGGVVVMVTNLLAETLFMALLNPIMAVTHTSFLTRLLVFRRAGGWSSQARGVHQVRWPLAFASLWPQMLVGLTLLGAVLLKSPGHFWFALLGTTGMILAAPLAVLTASPRLGAFCARTGIGRIPEESKRLTAPLAGGPAGLEGEAVTVGSDPVRA